MSEEAWTFSWGRIRGEVAALGGMLGPVWFTLADGREVQPFAVAPWAEDPAEQLATLPPILRRLRGDFPCVPFGVPETRTDLPDEWMAGVDASAPAVDGYVHGFGSNHSWHLVDQDDAFILIAIDYPEDHAVRRLERRISREGDLTLKIDLEILMRRDAALPVGLHPIFALPEATGEAQLTVPSLQAVRSFPVPVEAGSIILPGQTAPSLARMRTLDGNVVDASRLPLAAQTEELLALALTEGAVRLSFPRSGHAVDLLWDADTFPQCLLWVSNRGRSAYPWNGRFNALGVEPIAAAFDLGEVHSGNMRSPLAQAGIATRIALSADRPFRTSYRIRLGGI